MSKIQKFRKKPVVIEAQQWWPPGDQRHDPSMLVYRKGASANPPDLRQVGDLYQFSRVRGMGDDIFMIRTPGGSLKVFPGDWIITDEKGEKSPCSPGVFEATYERIES